MDTQKSKVIYTNHLGETFVLNELVYYYDYVTTDPMLDTW
jgi:hypothetical protein